MCLDHSAHGVVSTHEIFRKPVPVVLEYADAETPQNYRGFYNGRDLGPTMKMWQVQKTGYLGDPATHAGVVAGGWGFGDSPDSEYIAGGVNTKGPRYVALGRHGPFFQWGFSASPSEMTESGQQAFVNAICYIRKFDRQPPLTRKQRGSLHRGFALDRAMSMARMQENYKKLVDNHEKRAAARARAEQVSKSKSRALTDEEKWALKFPKVDPITWERYQNLFLGSMPKELVKRLGTDAAGLAKYLGYFEENFEYLYREGRGTKVDGDAKALGIPNRDPAILTKAVALLETDDAARGARLLARYTDKKFTTKAEWQSWLRNEAPFLFFSDSGGYRFYSSRRSDAVQRAAALAHPVHAKPTTDEPVAFDIVALGAAKAGGTVTIAVRMQVKDGWHAYASVGENSAYTNTSMTLELPDGMAAVGKWRRPLGVATLEDPFLTHYVGSVVFLHDVRLVNSKALSREVRVKIAWQACDESMCLPPSEVVRKVKLAQ